MIDRNNVKNILVTRTDRLGDVMLTLPLLYCLKKIFPEAKIFFLVKKYLKELLDNYYGIDEIIYADDDLNRDVLAEIIRTKSIDLAVNVKPDFKLASMFYRLGIKYRIGTGYRWFSFLYNFKVYEHRKNSDKHESELNLMLIRNFFNEDCAAYRTGFKIDKDKRDVLYKKLSGSNTDPNDKYIIIHPGSGGSAKDITPEKFSEFINLFSKDFPEYKIVMTGIQSENELTEKIIKDSDISGIINLCGKLNLGELLILINDCSLFISNSTGPIHIAGDLDKKIIGFYPNQKPMHAGRWKPLSSEAVIFSPDNPNDDMNEIDTKKIINAVKKLI